MAEARQSAAWDHTSLLVATAMNCRQGVRRRHHVRADRIHPFRRRERSTPVDGDTGARLLTHVLGQPSTT